VSSFKLTQATNLNYRRVVDWLFKFLQAFPVQIYIYPIAAAITAGARTVHQLQATVRAGFVPGLKVYWLFVSLPLFLSLYKAHLSHEVRLVVKVLPVIGTFTTSLSLDVYIKRKRLAALRKRYYVYSEGEPYKNETLNEIHRIEATVWLPKEKFQPDSIQSQQINLSVLYSNCSSGALRCSPSPQTLLAARQGSKQ
jgi:hypothetical protein